MFNQRHARHSFILEPVRERDLIIISLLVYRTAALLFFLFTLPYSPLQFYLIPSPFLPYFTLSFRLDRIFLNCLPSFFEQKDFELKNLSLSHPHSILLPLESKQCPLAQASILACADSADELRFSSMSGS